MDWGLRNRLAQIIKPGTNRALMLAVDHGYFLGPTERLENPKKVIAPLLEYCDSLMVTRGIQRTCVDPRTNVPMVLRVSGGSSIIGHDLSQEDITVSVQDAVRLNATAVAMSIFVGSKYEYQTVVNLGKLVGEAERYGLPVLAVTAVGKELGKDARYLSLACRVAAEQGAHVVKTYYCDNFEKVVQSCPVPIIVAGGKKIPERDALQLTFNAIKGGAAGVDMGRNIWQSDHPVAMIKAVRAIVHENMTVDQAFQLYGKLVGEESKMKPKSLKNDTRTGLKTQNPNQNNKPNSKKINPNQNNKPTFKTQNPNQNNKPNSKKINPNQNNKPTFKTQNRNQNNKPNSKKINPNQNNKPTFKTQNPNQNNKPTFKTQNPNQNNKPTFKTQNPNQNNKPSFKTQNPNQNNKPTFKTQNPNQNNKPTFKTQNPNQNNDGSNDNQNKPTFKTQNPNQNNDGSNDNQNKPTLKTQNPNQNNDGSNDNQNKPTLKTQNPNQNNDSDDNKPTLKKEETTTTLNKPKLE